MASSTKSAASSEVLGGNPGVKVPQLFGTCTVDNCDTESNGSASDSSSDDVSRDFLIDYGSAWFVLKATLSMKLIHCSCMDGGPCHWFFNFCLALIYMLRGPFYSCYVLTTRLAHVQLHNS